MRGGGRAYAAQVGRLKPAATKMCRHGWARWLAVTESALQDLLEASPFNRPYGFRVQSIGDGVCTVAVPFQFTYERPMA